MYKRTKEELQKFVKKNYQFVFVDEIIDLYKEIELKNKDLDVKQNLINCLSQKIQSLEEKLSSPEYALSEALGEYVKHITKDNIRTALDKLRIDVEGYYEPYSGQQEHYHKVKVSLDNF